MGLSFSQNPLIQPTLGVETSGTVTRELLQGLGEIIAEDTNNILVQVHVYLRVVNMSNLTLVKSLNLEQQLSTASTSFHLMVGPQISEATAFNTQQ